ncbi:MAG: peptide ABC transporter substrate-binding protein [Clostridiales bacterium]
MRRVISLLLFITIFIGIFSGCSEQENKENLLRIAVDVDLSSMDQNIATDGLSFEAIAGTIEGLYNNDKDGKLIPAIAKEYEMSKDGLVYTFKLRSDVKWSNGDKVTASDFVFAWRRLLDPDTASEYNFIGEVAGVKNAAKVVEGKVKKEELGIKAEDDTTLIIELDRPVPYFLSLMAFPTFFPLNEKFVTEKGENYALDAENLLANGPFKMKSWKKGYGFILEKNKDYYDAKNVSVDGLDYKVIKDNQTAALKYDNNELDVVKLSAELVDKYKSNQAYTQYAAGYIWYVTPNNKTELFSNLNARKAIQHAINKQHIVDKILNDGSIVADYIVPKDLAIGPDQKDFRENSGTFSEYDKELAVEYWDKAKKELGKSEFKVEFLFDDSETIKKTAEFIQAELETNLPGLKVELKSQPKKNRIDLMTDGDYEIGLTRWGPDYADPLTYLDLFLTDVINNYPNYTDKEYDKLVKSSANELSGDAKARWDAMISAEEILLDKGAAIVPLYQTGYSYLVNPKVKGIEDHTVGTPFIYRNVEVNN